MDIKIKSTAGCEFLRYEALAKAIYYEENYMNERGTGIINCALWIKEGTQNSYHIIVYHTKTSIVVIVREDVE